MFSIQRLAFTMVLAFGAGVLAVSPASAQDGPLGPGRLSLQVGAFGSNIDRARLREPLRIGGGVEVAFPDTRPAKGFALGLFWTRRSVGAGVGISYWGVDLADRRFPNAMQDTLSYSGASVRYVYTDFTFLYAPIRTLPVGIYGVVGMGVEARKFNLDDARPNYVDLYRLGANSDTEFGYSYGLGIRALPHWPVSVAAEYRWAPGELSKPLENCTPADEPGWEWCEIGAGSVANRTHILSAGVILSLPLRRSGRAASMERSASQRRES